MDEPKLKPKELLQGRVIKLVIPHGSLQKKPFCLLFKVAGVMQCKWHIIQSQVSSQRKNIHFYCTFYTVNSFDVYRSSQAYFRNWNTFDNNSSNDSNNNNKSGSTEPIFRGSYSHLSHYSHKHEKLSDDTDCHKSSQNSLQGLYRTFSATLSTKYSLNVRFKVRSKLFKISKTFLSQFNLSIGSEVLMSSKFAWINTA